MIGCCWRREFEDCVICDIICDWVGYVLDFISYRGVGSMRLGVIYMGVLYFYLSVYGCFYYEIGMILFLVVCFWVVNWDGESSRKGFGGGDENKKKVKK